MPWLERFWSKVEKGPGCWEWQGGRTTRGYGVFYRSGRASPQELTHRISYELANGPIPDRLVVCHRCDNPPCCNPAHLFVGTPGDNNRDSAAKGRAVNQQKTHCPQNHPYNTANTYTPPGTNRRMCRTCRREAQRVARQMPLAFQTIVNVPAVTDWEPPK